MSEETAVPVESTTGGKFKSVLLVSIIILVIGAGAAAYILMPSPPPELKAYQWPEEGDPGLEVSATLSDGSAILFTTVRFVSAPFNWENHLDAARKEYKEKKSILENILTDAAVSLDSQTGMTNHEFKKRVLSKVNKELKHSEVETILTSGWMLHPSG